jgi:hypothetical protein
LVRTLRGVARFGEKISPKLTQDFVAYGDFEVNIEKKNQFLTNQAANIIAATQQAAARAKQLKDMLDSLMNPNP